MFGLDSKVAGRIFSIQRKVSVAKRRPGRFSFSDMSKRLTEARRQVAQGRKGR
jgi:hypothetical protein